MAYEPQTWADGEEGGTPITAAALNHLEAGVGDAAAAADAAAAEAATAPAWGEVTGKPSTFPPAAHAATLVNVAADAASGVEAGTAQEVIVALAARVAALEAAGEAGA